MYTTEKLNLKKIALAVQTLESSITYKKTVYLFPIIHIHTINKAIFLSKQE